MFRSIGMVRFKHKINLFSNWQLQFASMYRNAPMCHSPHMIFKKEYFFLNYIICLCNQFRQWQMRVAIQATNTKQYHTQNNCVWNTQIIFLYKYNKL